MALPFVRSVSFLFDDWTNSKKKSTNLFMSKIAPDGRRVHVAVNAEEETSNGRDNEL